MERLKTNEDQKEREKRFKRLSSEERRSLIRKKLKMQGLTEGSGLKEKDQSSYNKEEIKDLILITRCFQKIKYNNSSK